MKKKKEEHKKHSFVGRDAGYHGSLQLVKQEVGSSAETEVILNHKTTKTTTTKTAEW